MTELVHKLAFDVFQTGNITPVRLPPGAKIVGFNFQDNTQHGFNTPTIWYVFDAEKAAGTFDKWETWDIQIRGDGDGFGADLEYLAGPLFINGFVFHLAGKKSV